MKERFMVTLRRFQKGDEFAVSDVICTTLAISNRKDYPSAFIEENIRNHAPEVIAARAAEAHFYVALDGEAIIGCGGITGYWGSTEESYLTSIFVLPDYQGKSVGRKIMETLEADEYFRRAWRTEVGSSLTAVHFYEKLGYAFKNGITDADEYGVVRLEKRKDTQMKVTYEHKPAMTFIGYSTSIRPEEGYQKCPEFWDREYARKYARLWQTMQPETPVEKAILENGVGLFAICDEKKGSFEYWIAGLYQGGAVPEGLKLYTFPESDWAMFSTKGPLPCSLQALNTQVWQEWYPTEGQKYIGNGNAMLEVYSPGDMQSPDYECGIWVPVCKPIEQNEHEAAEIVSTMMITGVL